MAPATAVLTILLLVSLVFAGHVKSEHLGLGGSHEQEPPPPVAGGAFPDSQCVETRLYRGPCVEILCATACLVQQMRHGGHCRGNLIKGHCYCFSCS